MFPVPSHLPRTGGDYIASTAIAEDESNHDPALDYLGQLVSNNGSLKGTIEQIKRVRYQLEEAINQNTKTSHELLLSNFPSISSHIRLGSRIRSDFLRLQEAISGLEREIDPSNPTTSFLPPLLNVLTQHHAAQQSRAKAEAHVQALRSLKDYTTRIERLEAAVWAGRGADDWVVSELENASDYKIGPGSEILKGTRILMDIESKMNLYRSMVTEQVTDAYSNAVSFAAPQRLDKGMTMSVQTRTSLQQPRIPRPIQAGETTKPSVPPPYPLSQIYAVLSRLSALSSLLQSLRNRVLRDLIRPIVQSDNSSHWKVAISKSDALSLLRLEAVSEVRRPGDVLADISSIIDFVSTIAIPSANSPLSERSSFLEELRKSVLQAVLDHVILPAMPSTLAAVPKWLEIVQQAVLFEASSDESEPKSGEAGMIKEFFEKSAGSAWAGQRRQRVAEEVRRLILGGWGGWEGVEVEQEKEVMVVVEVELDEEDSIPKKATDETMSNDEADFGWGFEDDQSKESHSSQEVQEEDDGWGFDESTNAEAGPSKVTPLQTPLETSISTSPEVDGWDFDNPLTEISPKPPVVPKPAKPAREAKRLGKKVAKVKHVEDEDDPWNMPMDTGTDQSSVTSNGRQESSYSSDEFRSWDTSEFSSIKSPDISDPIVNPAAETIPEHPRKKVMKEEKRVVKETYLTSRACTKLLEIAERILKECEGLQNNSIASPSFKNSPTTLQTSLTDIFDIYRLLLPTHFSTQITSVPALSFQVYNDHILLAEKVKALKKKYDWWYGSEDVISRLISGGERIFEDQVKEQVEGLLGSLDDCNGFLDVGGDGGFRRCERNIKGIVRDLETLARVLKVVLSTTTCLAVLGYLLDASVQKISNDILSLTDITELESNRLNDLVKLVHPLDSIFVIVADQPSTIVAQVPHWLKFCYVSELLQASLVDITYLFDTGALVDFTTSELVNLVRALFADSPKRDATIERIESGPPAGDDTNAA